MLVDFDMGQARLKFLIDSLPPEAAGLITMTICRDHQILVGILRPRRALPSLMARGVKTPAVLFINAGGFLDHRASPGTIRSSRRIIYPLRIAIRQAIPFSSAD